MINTGQIVNIYTQVQEAPVPSSLQRKGAIISIGGTTLVRNTYQYISSIASLKSVLSSTGNFQELLNMGQSFYSQGSVNGFYVLELGLMNWVQDQITALYNWDQSHPDTFYSYLVPKNWNTPGNSVGSITVTIPGSGYDSTATVAIDLPPNTQTAEGTAVLTGTSVTGITMTTIGSGYPFVPQVTIAPPDQTPGVQATATAVINPTTGSVISCAIVNAGSGYSTAPVVTFQEPGGGTPATASPVIQNGKITSINITSAGFGYLTTPNVVISAPALPGGTLANAIASLEYPLKGLCSLYASPTGRKYFFITGNVSNLTEYAPLKSAQLCYPSSVAPPAEFPPSMPFYQWLVNNPGSGKQLAPMGNRFSYGMTAWPRNGVDDITRGDILSNAGNLIFDSAEGGLSQNRYINGTCMDGTQASWWYGVDWFQINVAQAIAAAVINGSNSTIPLLYNQAGINALSAAAKQVASAAQTNGCALSATVNAMSFKDYVALYPNDYAQGIYSGLSAEITGQNGFLTINFYITAFKFAPTGSTGAAQQLAVASERGFAQVGGTQGIVHLKATWSDKSRRD